MCEHPFNAGLLLRSSCRQWLTAPSPDMGKVIFFRVRFLLRSSAHSQGPGSGSRPGLHGPGPLGAHWDSWDPLGKLTSSSPWVSWVPMGPYEFTFTKLWTNPKSWATANLAAILHFFRHGVIFPNHPPDSKHQFMWVFFLCLAYDSR